MRRLSSGVNNDMHPATQSRDVINCPRSSPSFQFTEITIHCFGVVNYAACSTHSIPAFKRPRGIANTALNA